MSIFLEQWGDFCSVDITFLDQKFVSANMFGASQTWPLAVPFDDRGRSSLIISSKSDLLTSALSLVLQLFFQSPCDVGPSSIVWLHGLPTHVHSIEYPSRVFIHHT